MKPEVYVFGAQTGEALYVGMTRNLTRRLIEHLRSDWGAPIGWFAGERMSSLEAADEVERWLIVIWQPRGNVQRRGGSDVLDRRLLTQQDKRNLMSLLLRCREYSAAAIEEYR